MTSYMGGKNGSGVYQQIINQIPPHTVYIEPFFGSGAVFRLKRRAEVSIGLDLDDAVIDYFRHTDGLTVMRGDGFIFLRDRLSPALLSPSTFVYIDPPYPFSVRAGRTYYEHEFGEEEQHAELLDAIVTLPCMVAISSYWSELYSSRLSDWRSINFPAMTRGGLKMETLWMNYPVPARLHDYSYLGKNYREREKIKRQKTRWLARLDRMDALQRYAMLASIEEYGEGHKKGTN